MNEPSLVILAAGMGSRFGGLKQITPIGDNGELIIDFSIYDALRAGFKKVVFIIKEENEADFERLIGSKVRPFAEVQYCYQSMTDIPSEQSVPEGRTKPWGTGHAALCCRSVVDGPFAVINSDDYYGPQAFQLLYDYLSTAKDDELAHYAMVGYRLGNTLTENGSVSRGVCEENEEHFLTCITERTKIEGRGSVAVFKEEDGEQELSLDTVVSMNMWAFTASALEALQQEFELFFAQKVLMDPMKAEFYLPSAVDAMIKAGKADVKVLRSPDKWYGVTYNMFSESVEITELERYVRRKRREGLTGFGMTHVIIAAYVRTVSKYPALNRFIAGQKIFSRGEDIALCMTVKKDMTKDSPDSVIKVHLHPGDTAADVYRKFHAQVDAAKDEMENTSADNTAAAFMMIPSLVLKFVIWLLKTLDYFGLIPRFLLEVSPFHGSVYFTSMGSLGIKPVYHHLYDFGTVPAFCAFGRKRRAEELKDGEIVERKYVDLKFNLDERICDGFYYAGVIKYFLRLLSHPDVLDNPPDAIEQDIP